VSIRRFSKGQIILITEYKKGSAIRELLPLFSPFLYHSFGHWGGGGGSSIANTNTNALVHVETNNQDLKGYQLLIFARIGQSVQILIN